MLAKVIIENGVKKIQALTADTGTGAPVGSIIVVCSNILPSGYLGLGVQYDITNYPALYQVLGTDTTPTASALGLPTLTSGQYAIKATSGLSENAQDNVVAQLNEERSYSETEINTGKKWIDGKPIYKKTIDCGALPSSGDKNVNHNISNLGYVTEIDGFSYNSTTKLTLNIPHTYTSEAQCVSVVVSETNIVLHVGTDRSTYNKTYVTLEYTKTTD